MKQPDPDELRSRWTGLELRASHPPHLTDKLKQEVYKFLELSVEAGRYTEGVVDRENLQWLARDIADFIFRKETEYPPAAIRPLDKKIPNISAGSLWNVPRRNPYFTGRNEDLEKLHNALSNDERAVVGQAIAGLGGIGKTQTAIEYCHRHRDAYGAVFWVRAETEEEIRMGFAELAGRLALAEADAVDQDAAVASVVRWLESNDDWLLVFDNADRPALLKPFLPREVRGQILLTSRTSSSFASLGIRDPFQIDTMLPEEAEAFLLDRAERSEASEDERRAVSELAQELGYLPLALEQAAAYVTASGALFRSYLESYAKRHLSLLEEARPQAGDYPATVATTWSVSFQEIEEESAASADLLRVLAFLAPDRIPLEIFEEGAAELGETLAEALSGDDPLALPKLLEPLQRFSLVERDVEARTVSIHRMVQAAVRTGLDERSWAVRVVRALVGVYPQKTEFENWPRCERLAPHARLAVGFGIVGESTGLLLHQMAVYAKRRGDLDGARKDLERSLEIKASVFGTQNNREVAASLHELARVLKAQGDLDGARKNLERSLEIQATVFGTQEHPSVAATLHELARVLQTQGDLDGSRRNLERSLEIQATVFGTQEHPSVAVSLHNLASVLQAQGDLAGARKKLERSLEIQATVFDTQEHPSVAASLHQLAMVLKAQGDLDGARKNFERSLEIKDIVFGTREHYETAIIEYNLGHLLQDLDKPGAARDLLEHAYQVFLNQLGPEHPYTQRLGDELGNGGSRS